MGTEADAHLEFSQNGSGQIRRASVSLGDLKYPQSPNEPIALQLTKMLNVPGRPRQEQHRLGRAELLATSFETFELKIRDQLARSLGGGGFDPARDMVAITVNRWPHGYAYTYNSLGEPMAWVFSKTCNH
jgi:spermidine dehydrogenase